MDAAPASVRSLSYAPAPPAIAVRGGPPSACSTPLLRSPSSQPPIPPPPPAAGRADDLLSAWRTTGPAAPPPLSQARRAGLPAPGAARCSGAGANMAGLLCLPRAA